jgi:hypothetical protein
MKTILLLIALAASASAQRFQSDCYAVQAERWTNWDFPDLIKPHMPIPPEQKDGVHLFIKAQCDKTPATLRVQIKYTTAEGVKRVFSDVALLNRDEESGAVGGYLVAIIGRGVTVRDVVVTPYWPTDAVEVDLDCPPGLRWQPLGNSAVERQWKVCK